MARAALPAGLISKASASVYDTTDLTKIGVSGGSCVATQDTTVTRNRNRTMRIDCVNAASIMRKGAATGFTPTSLMSLDLYIPFIVSGSMSLAITLTNATSVGANYVTFTWNLNALRQGWNTLKMWSGETGTTAGSGTLSNGASRSVGGTGVDFTQAIQCIEMNFQNMQARTVWMDEIRSAPRNRVKVIMGFDASEDTIETIAVPLFASHGWLGYITATHIYDMDPTLEHEPWERMQRIYDAGWDIVNHTWNHPSGFTAYNAQQVYDEIVPTQNLMRQYGWTRGLRYMAYPENSVPDTAYLEPAFADAGIVWGRGSKKRAISLSELGADNRFHLGSIEMGAATTVTQFKAALDSSIIYGDMLITFGHYLSAGGNSDTAPGQAGFWSENQLIAWCDYLKAKERQGLIDVVSFSQWEAGMLGQRRAA